MSLNKELVLEKEISSVRDFDFIIDALQTQITPRTCFFLSGDLGAGKTAFVQRWGARFGFIDITSPTFALHQMYENTKTRIDHFDLYRLESAEDIETAGLWDVFSESRGLVFIEWPERISIEDVPMDWNCFELSILKKDDETRKTILSRFLR